MSLRDSTKVRARGVVFPCTHNSMYYVNSFTFIHIYVYTFCAFRETSSTVKSPPRATRKPLGEAFPVEFKLNNPSVRFPTFLPVLRAAEREHVLRQKYGWVYNMYLIYGKHIIGTVDKDQQVINADCPCTHALETY